MKSLRPKQLFIDVIAALFVLLFLYTAVMKLKDISYFRSNISHSSSISAYAGWLSWFVPLSELLAVLLLIIPRSRMSGIVASAALMLLFTGYTGYILANGSPLPCTCGGVISDMGWTAHFVFNSTLLILSIIAILIHYKQNVLTRSSRTPAI